jgi:7,8-dihydro-6-hydroxymethylpterin-pyrophosphokinase
VERDFMLLPLLEIAPTTIDPATGQPLQDRADAIQYRQIIARI